MKFDSTRITRALMSQIALVDCNNFYASCERVFQPRLAESELAVLTNQCLSRDRGAHFPDCSICDSDKPKLFG